MTKTITVKSCAECPFFCVTTGSFLAGLLRPGVSDTKPVLMGVCDAPTDDKTGGVLHHAFGAIGPEASANRDRLDRRMRIKDGTTLPEKCPLRATDVFVTLGS